MSRVVRSFKNVTKGYSGTQVKVRNATCNDPWGPTGADLAEIAALTFATSLDFYEIMDMLDKRLNDKPKNWRHILKSLKVLDYCLHEGSEMVVIWARKNVYLIKSLREFIYVDDEGRDVGRNVRLAASELTALILDEDRLRAERSDRKLWKARVSGVAEPPLASGVSASELDRKNEPRQYTDPDFSDTHNLKPPGAPVLSSARMASPMTDRALTATPDSPFVEIDLGSHVTDLRQKYKGRSRVRSGPATNIYPNRSRTSVDLSFSSVDGDADKSRGSNELDKLATELEALKTHWKNPDQNSQLSDRLQPEGTLTGTKNEGDTGIDENLIAWRKARRVSRRSSWADSTESFSREAALFPHNETTICASCGDPITSNSFYSRCATCDGGNRLYCVRCTTNGQTCRHELTNRLAPALPDRDPPPPTNPLSTTDGNQSILAVTDSGYASLNPAKHIQNTIESEAKESAEHLSNFDDGKTVYSDNASVETSQRTSFVDRLAELLLEALKDMPIGDICTSTMFEDIKDNLADFALRLGQENSSPKLRKAMAFIHKYRALVGATFEGLLRQDVDDVDEKRRTSLDNMPLGELMDRWFDHESTTIPAVPEVEFLDLEDEPSIDDLTTQDSPSELDLYAGLISDSESYKWLTSLLRNKLLLSYENDSTRQSIRQQVLSGIPKDTLVRVNAPRRIIEAVFKVDWPLYDFLEAQWETDSGSSTLGNIMTVTGCPPDVQMMYCEKYLQQTWPTTGTYLAKLIDEALQNESQEAFIWRPDGACLTVNLANSECTVSISGSRDMAVEFAEQLAWLSSALRMSAEQNELSTCIPSVLRQNFNLTGPPLAPRTERIAGLGNEAEVYLFQMQFEFGIVPQHNINGSCWQQLLPCCTIVEGFPIRKRASPSLGMETPLNAMAALVGTDRVNQYCESLYIRGFSAILSPTQMSKDTMVWHLTCVLSGSHISYLQVTQQPPKVDFEDLENKRHIVGWCTSVVNRVGSDETDCPMTDCQLPGTRPGCALDGFRLTFPKDIAHGPTFALLRCQKSIHLASATYFAKLKYLKDRFALFWDTEDDRGWLTNFLVAYLYLVRGTFEQYEGSIKAELMSLWKRLRLVGQSVLASQSLELTTDSLSWPLVDLDQNSPSESKDDSVAEVAHQIFTRACDSTFDGVDKLITYQEQIEHDDARRSGRSLRNLEGWDFYDLVSHHGSKRPRIASLPTVAFTWAKFLRSLGTVTFFGEGFGELLSPGRTRGMNESSVEPSVATKGDCQNLEVGRYLVAASLRDLRSKIRKSRFCPGALLLGDAAILPMHTSMFQHCNCPPNTNTTVPQSGTCVRMPWPLRHKKLITLEVNSAVSGNAIGPKDFASRYIDGAIILGHDYEVGYFLDDKGNPIKGAPPDPLVEQEEAFNDSGIGTDSNGISQDNNLLRLASGSTDGPSSQTSAMFPGDPGQNYGNSWVGGGTPIFGNVYNVTNHHNNTMAASQTAYMGMQHSPPPHSGYPPFPALDSGSAMFGYHTSKRPQSESRDHGQDEIGSLPSYLQDRDIALGKRRKMEPPDRLD